MQAVEGILAGRIVLDHHADILHPELGEIAEDVFHLLHVTRAPIQDVGIPALFRAGQGCIQDLAAALEGRRGEHGLGDVVAHAADQEVGLVVLDQFGHGRDGQVALALIVTHDIVHATAVDAAGGVQGIEIGFDAGHVVAPDGAVLAGEVDRLADHDGFACAVRQQGQGEKRDTEQTAGTQEISAEGVHGRMLPQGINRSSLC